MVINRATIKRMIGKPYKIYGFRDSDGDGIKNIIDCEPYNPRKQGISHDIAKFAAEKTLRGKPREKALAEIERRRGVSDRAAEARREERETQIIKTAKFRETRRGERQRSYIKGGGFAGSLRGGLRSLSAGMAAGPYGATLRPRTKRRKAAKRKGKRKRKKVITYEYV